MDLDALDRVLGWVFCVLGGRAEFSEHERDALEAAIRLKRDWNWLQFRREELVDLLAVA
ncbi:MAG: hypothetical protein QM736_19690 [Vicinamibacterales bacterium]